MMYINEGEARFRIFYIVCLLWKLENRKVDDLRRILGINRTLYTKILSLNPEVDLSTHVERLEEITNVAKDYWIGNKCIFLSSWNSSEENAVWKSYISLRKQNQKGRKTYEQIEKEQEIKKKYKNALNEPSKENTAMSQLLYFASYGQKRPQRNAEECLLEIQTAIEKVTKSELEHVSHDKLNSHLLLIRRYMERIQAVYVLKQWEN